MRGKKWFKGKAAAFFLAMLLAVNVFSGSVVSYAASDASSETTVPRGYTPIYTVEDLYGINDNLKGKYILMNDIDLSETAPGGNWDSGNGWAPIGTVGNNDVDDESEDFYNDYGRFSGILDGNGHYIKNMTIYGTFRKGAAVGLFRNLGGKVKNLGLVDIDIDIDENVPVRDYWWVYAGGIAAECSDDSEISGCFVTGTIKHHNTYDEDTYDDEDLYSDGDRFWDGWTFVGGLTGAASDAVSDYNYFWDCYSDVDIVSSAKNIGGISGYGGKMERCYVNGSISATEGSSRVFGSDDVNNCYYPANMVTDGEEKGTPLTVAQMKLAKCYTGFDFDKTWIIDRYSSCPYPQLRNCMQVRIKSMELVSLPDKLTYTEGEQLDLTGAQVKITYDDDYAVTAPLETSMLTDNSMDVGTQTVVVAYGGFTDDFQITVKEMEESLKITEKKTKLTVGDAYKYKAEYKGMGKLTFASSNSRVLRIDQTSGKAVAKKAGKVTVTVRGGKLSEKFEVTVANKAAAKTTVSYPKRVTVTADNYYKYWDAHRSALEKAGYIEGDGQDAFVAWSKVAGADGYVVKLTWNEAGESATSVVNVKKSGGKYIFTTTGGRYRDKEIAATTRNSIVKGTSKKFTGKKLAFYVSAAGSDIQIEEVKVRAYKNVKGKKVYGKAVTVTDIIW